MVPACTDFPRQCRQQTYTDVINKLNKGRKNGKIVLIITWVWNNTASDFQTDMLVLKVNCS